MRIYRIFKKKILKQPQSKLTCKVQKYDTEKKIENKYTESTDFIIQIKKIQIKADI